LRRNDGFGDMLDSDLARLRIKVPLLPNTLFSSSTCHFTRTIESPPSPSLSSSFVAQVRSSTRFWRSLRPLPSFPLCPFTWTTVRIAYCAAAITCYPVSTIIIIIVIMVGRNESEMISISPIKIRFQVGWTN
jgi:hypothetical protein